MPRSWRDSAPAPIVPPGASVERRASCTPSSSNERPSSNSVRLSTWMAISWLGRPLNSTMSMPRPEQFVLHLPRQRDELAQVAAAGEQHGSHQLALAQRIHVWRLDVGREAADLCHGLLDAIHRILHVRVRLHFHFHERCSVAADAHTDLTSGTVLSCCSSGVVISFSTSSALAPRHAMLVLM